MWEMIIGLEVHAELKTRTKVFCACENIYGAAPNSHVCPTCMGLPGALPVVNREAVRLAAKAGMALGCAVHPLSRFDRKNYFYPDLPKAYQITQFFHPICTGGSVMIGEKRIGVTRIHIEEDAGKLIHGTDGTLLDMNRCGVPLIEIVSEPDIRSAAEAVAYLRKLRAILLYAGVSDCRMNEGSLRCDVNLSVHRVGEPWGTRTEMKNLNSFQSVERAIEAEYRRQVDVLEQGGEVCQETRRYDQKTGLTYGMRQKENSADYRYFPEPDIPWIEVTPDELRDLRASIPPLPDERREHLLSLGLPPRASELLTEELWLSNLFDQAAALAADPVALANLILGEGFSLMTQRGLDVLPIKPERLAALSGLMASGKVNSTTGKKILAALFDGDFDPEAYAKEHDLFLITDDAYLETIVQNVLAANPDMVMRYASGKINVAKALMGKAMAEARGKADPEKLSALVLRLLSQPRS